MDDLANRLRELPPCRFGIHETALAQKLGIEAEEGSSQHERLTQLINFLSSGGGNGLDSPVGKVNLRDSENRLGRYFEFYGNNENFHTHEGGTVLRQPRYLRFKTGNFKMVSMSNLAESGDGSEAVAGPAQAPTTLR